MKKILFVSSEVAPFAKSGGLGDVIGSLPKELIKLGYDVSVIMPRYKQIECEMEYVMDYPIYMQGRKENCIIRKNKQDVDGKTLTTYFVDNITYFDRGGMYCYSDEAERFAFFDKAVVKFIQRERPEVVHLNDWQTGPIALLLKEKVREVRPKIIYTIHNLEYDGKFNKGNLYHFDLDDSFFSPSKFEFYGDISFTKAGIVYADIVTTVSKTYAGEIQTSQYGFGYEGLLHQKAIQGKLVGIVHGIDYDEYNPKTDDEIAKNYDSDSIELKAENKKDLQKSLGLPEEDVPLISVVSRVVYHKGFDILLESMNELLENNVQFVALGVGEEHYINRMKYLKDKYPNKVSVNDYFDTDLAKRIYAGSDLFMMPSMFEPCGLSQMISLRYGTIPVVRTTGGLRDTIVGYLGNQKDGNGFTFWGNQVEDLIEVTNKALKIYDNKDEWKALVKKTMNDDFSWARSAKEYAKLYE